MWSPEEVKELRRRVIARRLNQEVQKNWKDEKQSKYLEVVNMVETETKEPESVEKVQELLQEVLVLRSEANSRRIWLETRLARDKETADQIISLTAGRKEEMVRMEESARCKEDEAAWLKHRLDTAEKELIRLRGVRPVQMVERRGRREDERERSRREERDRRQGDTRRGQEAAERANRRSS